MQIIVQADDHTVMTEELDEKLNHAVRSAVSRYEAQITRIQVYLSDVNGGKDGVDDKRCVLEARPAGLDPVAANHRASTIELAIDGASAKLASVLVSTFGRLGSSRNQGSPGSE